MQQDQISDETFTEEEVYTRSSTGKRFANYAIDMLVFYLLFFVFGLVLAFASPGTVEDLGQEKAGFNFTGRIMAIIAYAFYMSIVESIFRGKSIGKFITNTRAVNLDGSQISTGTAFSRGFSRAVPFCVLSAFGNPCNPWQDRWTDTMVIDDNNQQAPPPIN